MEHHFTTCDVCGKEIQRNEIRHLVKLISLGEDRTIKTATDYDVCKSCIVNIAKTFCPKKSGDNA